MTDALIEAANAAGIGLFSRTVLDGRSVMRISIGARATKAEHVNAMWDRVIEIV
jgi:aromatic-L-amino-acid decarboxylase